MTDLEDKAHCRGCRRELRGHPYYTGKSAYLPENDVPALAHHFGGWVCSAQCERRVFEDMKGQGVWGSVEATKMANAYDRHETHRRQQLGR